MQIKKVHDTKCLELGSGTIVIEPLKNSVPRDTVRQRYSLDGSQAIGGAGGEAVPRGAGSGKRRKAKPPRRGSSQHASESDLKALDKGANGGVPPLPAKLDDVVASISKRAGGSGKARSLHASGQGKVRFHAAASASDGLQRQQGSATTDGAASEDRQQPYDTATSQPFLTPRDTTSATSEPASASSETRKFPRSMPLSASDADVSPTLPSTAPLDTPFTQNVSSGLQSHTVSEPGTSHTSNDIDEARDSFDREPWSSVRTNAVKGIRSFALGGGNRRGESGPGWFSQASRKGGELERLQQQAALLGEMIKPHSSHDDDVAHAPVSVHIGELIPGICAF